MASELSIVIKASALIGGAMGALRSLVGGVDGVRSSVQELEREQSRLKRAMGMFGQSDGLSKLQHQYDTLGKNIRTLKANAEIQTKITTRLDSLRDAREQMKSEVLGAAASVGVVLTPVKFAMDFESAMADVKKVVNFDTPQQFKEMQRDILQLTHTLPMSAKELAAIAASGGQLGVARADIAGFTEQVAKMSVAFDMSAEDAGDAMAKLANVYKIPIKDIGILGDAINELSNNSAAKASDIVNTLGRVGGVAKQFGLTELQAASLANTFISLGKAPEVAGTAINGMLTKLSTADKQGAKFQKALQSMGLSAKDLKRAIAENGEQALMDFLKQVNKLPKENQMGALVDLFGLEYADDIAVLVGNIDAYRKSVDLLQRQGKDGQPAFSGSMDKEYQSRMSTTAAQWQTFKNQIVHLGISIGAVVLPAVNALLAEMKPLVDQFIRFSETHPGLVKNVFLGIAAFTGLKAGALMVRFGINMLSTAFFGLFGKSMAAWGAVLRLSTALRLLNMGRSVTALRALGLSAAQARAAIRSFSGLVQLMRMAFSGLGHALMTVWRILPLVGQAFMVLGRALLMNPIGIALTLMATAAYLLYSRWGAVVGGAKLLWQDLCSAVGTVARTMAQFFSDMWLRIRAFFSSGIAGLSATIANWSPLGLFYRAFAAVLSWFGVTLPAQFTQFGQMILNGLINGIRTRAAAAWNAITDIGNGIKKRFQAVVGIHSPSRVFARFGDYLMSGLQVGVRRSAALPVATVGRTAQSLQQHFAARAGGLAADWAARVSPHSEALTRARTERPAENNITIHFNPTIHAPGGEPQAVRDAVKMGLAEFETLFRRMMADRERRAY